jgi:solute:Na+ symporter, SSS family
MIAAKFQQALTERKQRRQTILGGMGQTPLPPFFVRQMQIAGAEASLERSIHKDEAWFCTITREGVRVPNLAAADNLILLIYCFFVLAVGISLKPLITSSQEFLQAGRSLPAWICGIAMTMASLGSQETIGMGAAGANYGLASIPFYLIGAIPAILFAGLFLLPTYYGSKARTLPEFLALRFDQKTRVLHAVLFAAMAVFSAGVSLYVMGRVFAALHVFEEPLRTAGLETQGSLMVVMAAPAALVLAYILLGGLTGTVYNLVIQFFVLVAGLLPLVFLGLKQIGGWNGLKAAADLSSFAQKHGGPAHASAATMAAAAALGLVVAAGTWCADFRVLQAALAAEDVAAARKASLIATVVRIAAPLLFIVPAIVALGLPTPRTTIMIHKENGTIFHETVVVPPEVESGQGLVPAKMDAATGKLLKDASGRTVLDEAMSTPNLLIHFLPDGLLGLGLAALLASMMAGVAASVTAFSTVFTCDLYEPLGRKKEGESKPIVVMRWAAVAGTVLAFGVALAAMRFNDLPSAMALVFGLVIAPLLAALLLGVLWKGTTGSGAFAGLIAGAIAALLHHGLTLPTGEPRGIHGGWIAVLHRPSNDLRLSVGTGLVAFVVSLIVTAGVSLFTQARIQSEPAALVESAADSVMKMDMRIPLGMLFTLTGTILTAFGLSTRDNVGLYIRSLNINVNLWWGVVLLAFGVVMLTLGRRGQAKMEKTGDKGTREQGNKKTRG